MSDLKKRFFLAIKKIKLYIITIIVKKKKKNEYI